MSPEWPRVSMPEAGALRRRGEERTLGFALKLLRVSLAVRIQDLRRSASFVWGLKKARGAKKWTSTLQNRSLEAGVRVVIVHLTCLHAWPDLLGLHPVA